MAAESILSRSIAAHIGRRKLHSGVFTVTPQDAAELMERNAGPDWKNRPVARGTVFTYSREMAAGRWKVTGEGLIFTRSGKLRNGQHRLLACVKSGVSFDTFVMFGVDDDTFAFMDRGKVREASDIFAMMGELNNVKVAAATSWVWRYCNGQMLSGGHRRPTPDELYAYYRDEHPDLAGSAGVAGDFSRKKEKLAAPSMMVALHYLSSLKDELLADSFFRMIATGAEIRSTRVPTYILRDKLLQARLVGARLPDATTAALTIKAWNAVRTKTRLVAKTFDFRPAEEAFPEII